MARIAVLPLLIAFSLAAQGQSWCPPGADWHWSLYGFALDGYLRRQYTGDTLIGGRDAQKIRETGYTINYIANDTSDYNDMHFTAVENDDVLLWVQYDNVWQWDTLYRFGAVPGDIWRPAGINGDPAYCLVQVVDTATVLIDGVPLRQLMLRSLLPDSTLAGGGGHITERIGFEFGLWNLGYGCATDGPLDIFRCYSDVDISYVGPNWHWGCDSDVGIGELGGIKTVVFPNPGTDHFTVKLPSGTHFLELYDATGHQVLRAQVSGGLADVNTTALAPGLYSYRLMDPSGRVPACGKWAKE